MNWNMSKQAINASPVAGLIRAAEQVATIEVQMDGCRYDGEIAIGADEIVIGWMDDQGEAATMTYEHRSLVATARLVLGLRSAMGVVELGALGFTWQGPGPTI
jgi:hypothetical protein